MQEKHREEALQRGRGIREKEQERAGCQNHSFYAQFQRFFRRVSPAQTQDWLENQKLSSLSQTKQEKSHKSLQAGDHLGSGVRNTPEQNSSFMTVNSD